MSRYRSLTLFVLFFLDVRVRADVHEVKDCWSRRLPCAVASEESRRELKTEGATIVMASRSLIEAREAAVVQLMRGTFLVKTDASTTFATPYARIRCEQDCRGIFQRETDSITVRALSGRFIVRRLGEDQEYRLDAGLQVSVAEVGEAGVAEMEFPQGLPWQSTVRDWASLFTGDRTDFKKQVAEFRAVWREAVEQVSRVHGGIAGREIASDQNSRAQHAARAAAEAREERRLRELFRSKNGFD